MSPRSPIRRWLQARTGWLLVIVPTALAVLANPSPLERLDLLLYDAIEPLVAPAPAAEPQAVIVAIDERSLRQLGQWPWPRSTHARLIDKLEQAGVQRIALDLMFPEPDRKDERQDRELAAAIKRSGKVVLSMDCA